MVLYSNLSTFNTREELEFFPRNRYTIRKYGSRVQEAKLILLLKQGDQRAVTQWFSLYHNRLLRVTLQKVSVHADAEELVQETFLNCMRQIGLFRGTSSLWTWMNSILRHEISDFYRKKYAKKALKTLPLFDRLAIDDIHSSSDVSAKVSSVLKKMSTEYRELLQQKYIDKCKVVEIASRFGRSNKAIESDLFRARQEFQYLWLQEE